MAYIQGESRSQTSLFPVSLEELIPEDHLVRVAQYLADLDAADKSEGEQVVDRTAIKAALARLEAKQQDNRSCQALMKSMGLEQFNTHESDARMMRTPTRLAISNNGYLGTGVSCCDNSKAQELKWLWP